MRFPDPIPGILPFGTVTLLAGAPAAGKTPLLADWIRRWRAAEPIMGYPTHAPTTFYYIAVDRGWDSYAPIFDAAGVPDLAHYSVVDDTTVSPATLRRPYAAQEMFDRALAHLNPLPGSHLIVDPVSPILIMGNPNQARDVASTMIAFARCCIARQLNITLTAHFGKQRNDAKDRYQRPEDRISGSGAFSGFTHTQMYLINPELPKQPYHILGWNPRHAAPEEFKLLKGADGKFSLYGTDHTDTQTLAALAHSTQVLGAFPPAGEQVSLSVLVAGVQVACGLSSATIRRTLDDLIRSGQVCRMGRGRYMQVRPA